MAAESESFSESLLWRGILRQFLSADDAFQTLEQVPGGFSGAVVVFVQATSGQSALRGWPPDSLPENRVLELHRFLKHLHDRHLPVSVPLASRTGYSTIVDSDSRFWQLEPWLPGGPITDADLNDQTLKSVMETLANLHLASVCYQATPDGEQWFGVGQGTVPAITERIDLIERRSRQTVRADINSLALQSGDFPDVASVLLNQFLLHADDVLNELRGLKSVRFQLFPCWRDLWSAHVLLDGNRVTGLLDACAARTDHPGTDLSRFLGSIAGDNFSLWNVALTAYSRIRRLHPSDLNVVAALDRSSVLLSGLSWIDRWKAGDVPRSHQMQVVERMQRFEERMRNLHRPRSFEVE